LILRADAWWATVEFVGRVVLLVAFVKLVRSVVVWEALWDPVTVDAVNVVVWEALWDPVTVDVVIVVLIGADEGGVDVEPLKANNPCGKLVPFEHVVKFILQLFVVHMQVAAL
jgi:hypothetical protein